MNVRRPVLVGLVGGIAAGKSSVASALCADRGLAAELGGAVASLDLDAVLRAGRTEPGSLRDAVAALCPAARREDGSLDAARLADAAFADPTLLAALETLQWPLARAASRRAHDEAAATGARVLLVEGIALGSPTFAKELDALVLLDAPPEVRARRASTRGLAADAFRRRDAAGRPHLASAEAAARFRVDASRDLSDVVHATGKSIRALCSGGAARHDTPR